MQYITSKTDVHKISRYLHCLQPDQYSVRILLKQNHLLKYNPKWGDRAADDYTSSK